jgi:hypothetical protein
MSYCPFQSSLKNTKIENINKKEKFIDRTNEKHIFNNFDKTWSKTELLKPEITNKRKIKLELTKQLNPNIFDRPITNMSKEKNSNICYYPPQEKGAGHGFGNLSISNQIRFGDNTRMDTKVFKANKESQLIDRWDFIDDRYQNPNNLVMQLPRGGDSTRSQSDDLNYDKIEKNKEFDFKY